MLRLRILLILVVLLVPNQLLVAEKIIFSANTGILTKLTDFCHIYEWALKFRAKNPKFLIAAIGRPSAPVYHHLEQGMLLYWTLFNSKAPIVYGDLQGEKKYRVTMAKAFTRLYDTKFAANNIIFTVGGRMGLSAISHTIKQLYPHKKIVLTLPYYPDHRKLYKNDDLILINTLENRAFTAHNLSKALKGVDPQSVGAFIFCSPNNPMGWIISGNEWKKIAKILLRYKNTMIVLDEAYAELVLTGEHVSLITVAPELKNRVILLRSATKGLSAAGERMAILATWNMEYLTCLNEFQSMHLIHPPKSSQFAYAYAMAHFTNDDAKKLAQFYRPMVRKIEKQLREHGFLYNNSSAEGAFYAMIDLSCLIGQPMDKATQAIYGESHKIIKDDIDLAFHLMARHGIALMPLSLFGIDPKKGLLRMTCSLENTNKDQLTTILDNITKELSNIVAANQ